MRERGRERNREKVNEIMAGNIHTHELQSMGVHYLVSVCVEVSIPHPPQIHAHGQSSRSLAVLVSPHLEA